MAARDGTRWRQRAWRKLFAEIRQLGQVTGPTRAWCDASRRMVMLGAAHGLGRRARSLVAIGEERRWVRKSSIWARPISNRWWPMISGLPEKWDNYEFGKEGEGGANLQSSRLDLEWDGIYTFWVLRIQMFYLNIYLFLSQMNCFRLIWIFDLMWTYIFWRFENNIGLYIQMCPY